MFRKLLLVSAICALSRSVRASASKAGSRSSPFKPMSEAVVRPRTSSPFTSNDVALGLSRGGDGGGLSKTAVVKAHAWLTLAYSLMFGLESFGISAPVVGFSSVYKDFDPCTPFTIGIMRFLASTSLFMWMTELEWADNPTCQKFFDLYHIPLAVSGIIMAKNAAANKIGAAFSLVPALFLALGVISS